MLIKPYRLIGEPVTRPDGQTLALYETEYELEVHIDDKIYVYGHDTVTQCGQGNLNLGRLAIGAAAYNDPLHPDENGCYTNRPIPIGFEEDKL
jgi:hypothetical protein